MPLTAVEHGADPLLVHRGQGADVPRPHHRHHPQLVGRGGLDGEHDQVRHSHEPRVGLSVLRKKGGKQ